jgi:hypothetical protein
LHSGEEEDEIGLDQKHRSSVGLFSPPTTSVGTETVEDHHQVVEEQRF